MVINLLVGQFLEAHNAYLCNVYSYAVPIYLTLCICALEQSCSK
jgi:hypothetical protein